MRSKTLSTFSAAVLLGGGALLAACEGDRTASPGYSSYSGTAYSAPSGQVTSFRSARAEDVIGKSVYTTSGERIGEIDDVVVNRNSRVTAAVLGVGGFLGVGEKKAVVPIRELSWQGDRIVAPNMTKEALQRSAYDAREWAPYERDRALVPSG